MSPEVAQSWVQKIRFVFCFLFFYSKKIKRFFFVLNFFRKNMEFLKEKWVLNQVSATEIHADENIYIKDLRFFFLYNKSNELIR